VKRVSETEPDTFLKILLEVCQKTVHNAMIQNARMLELWKRHLLPYHVNHHAISQYSFDKLEFVQSVPFRVEVLDACLKILNDSYLAIKMISIALFQDIPPQLPELVPDFSTDTDIELFKLKIAEKFINSLMAFFAAEKDLVTPEMFIYGKISTTIRVKKSMRLEEISTMLAKDCVELTPFAINEAMQRFVELGLIDIDADDPALYLHVKKLELSPEQEQDIASGFFPIVEWAIETWRTMFNIRELNTPIPDWYPRKEALSRIVSYAATQGFTNARYCMSELKKYFQLYQQES